MHIRYTYRMHDFVFKTFFFYIKQKNIIGTYFSLNTKSVFEVILISQPTAVRVVGVLLAYSVLKH